MQNMPEGYKITIVMLYPLFLLPWLPSKFPTSFRRLPQDERIYIFDQTYRSFPVSWVRGIRSVHKDNKSKLLLIHKKIWISSGGMGKVKYIEFSQALKEAAQRVGIVDTAFELQEMRRNR